MSYQTTVRGKWMFDGAKSLSDMIDRCLDQANQLQEMKKAGIQLQDEVADDYAFLTTDDPKVAKQFEMWKEEAEDE